MQTTYETCLNEFRDASAAVRRAFGAVAEARELQIIANSQHQAASHAHAQAVERLDQADKALTQARADVGAAMGAEQHTAASTTAALFAGVKRHDAPDGAPVTSTTWPAPRVTQAEIDAIEPRANGTIDAQAAGIGIG